jgi:isopentenyl diphosphate isomerase/L-lactate dehydrogenase-like FMN-dependent dehydrogenase
VVTPGRRGLERWLDPAPRPTTADGAHRVSGWRDSRLAAQRRLPRVAFDFIDGGADDEVTLRRNRQAFDEVSLVPRVLQGAADPSTEITLFERRLDLPVLLAPTGGARIAGRDGELAAARGATAAGTVSVMSCFSSIPLDEIVASVPEPQWFQLYLFRDRGLMREMVERAHRLEVQALVLTVDTPVAGNRERDTRNGFTIPVRITARTAVDAMRHPRWTWHYLTGAPLEPHVDSGPTGNGSAPRELRALAEYAHSMFNPRQTWDDVNWLRSEWSGPLLVKGVLSADDAELAVEAGCEGVIVSNHGGRQLDTVPATIEVLPEIVNAVDGRAEVLIDGGIRRGTDVVKALSLGASACLIGRPWLYALAAGGQTGVTTMLEQLRVEIVRDLQLLGASSVEALGADYVRCKQGTSWTRDPIGTPITHRLREE